MPPVGRTVPSWRPPGASVSGMTTPPEGTQPPTGPQDPYATPAGGTPPAEGSGTPPAGGPFGSPPPGPYGAPPAGPYGAPPAGAQGAPDQPHGAPGQPYGGPGYGAPGYGGVAPAVDDRPTDVVSVVGLVLAFLLAPVGLVLSIIGLTRTSGGRRKGRGLAIAGVIVSVVMSLVLAAGVVALVALGRFVAEEGSTAFDELEESFPTADPFTVEPFPGESFPAVPDEEPVDPASLLALGETADLDGLVLAVTAVDLDADADVAAESADNPAPSGRYVLVSGTVENTSEEPQEVYLGLNVGYLSAAGSLYDEFTCSATVSGAAVDTAVLDPGASADVRWCLDVPVEEVGGGSVQVAATVTGTAAGWSDQ